MIISDLSARRCLTGLGKRIRLLPHAADDPSRNLCFGQGCFGRCVGWCSYLQSFHCATFAADHCVFTKVLTNFFICNASDTQYGSFFQQSPFDHVYKWDCCTQQVKQLLSPQRFSWEADRSLTHRAPLNSSMYRQLPSCFDLDQFGHTGLH